MEIIVTFTMGEVLAGEFMDCSGAVVVEWVGVSE